MQGPPDRDSRLRPRWLAPARRVILTIFTVLVLLRIGRSAGLGYRTDAEYVPDDGQAAGGDPTVLLQNTEQRRTYAGLFTVSTWGAPYTLQLFHELPTDTPVTAVVLRSLVVRSPEGVVKSLDDVELPVSIAEVFHVHDRTMTKTKSFALEELVPLDAAPATLVVEGTLSILSPDGSTPATFAKHFRLAKRGGLAKGL
ncbi:MAG TPA: hypothetical protein VK762_10780 [Polyangiaceae bacterium]|jgi:hypothetical protein|nr:hypothetical protein [Polyangiaceae bacterium]